MAPSCAPDPKQWGNSQTCGDKKPGRDIRDASRLMSSGAPRESASTRVRSLTSGSCVYAWARIFMRNVWPGLRFRKVPRNTLTYLRRRDPRAVRSRACTLCDDVQLTFYHCRGSYSCRGLRATHSTLGSYL